MKTASSHFFSHTFVADRYFSPMQAFDRVRATVSTWRKRARERRALSLLSPRLRRDIGLKAEDVWREVGKPFWRA